VVFEVGGVIDLGGHSLKITEPFLTIAGQTAPSPGITLVRGGIDIHGHDVIIRHIRVRPGEAGHEKKSGWEVDAMGTIGAYQVIVDHCSCTWATDENLSASGERFKGETPEDWRRGTSHQITFSHCLIAEGLSKATHAKGEHSKGSLLHDNTTDLSILGNLYASNMERNPLCKGGVSAVIANNWIFNPGRRAIHHALVAQEWVGHEPQTSHIAVVGNVLEYGPSTPPKMPLFLNHYDSPLELYLEDNLATDREGQPVPATSGVADSALVKQRPFWPAGYQPMPASEVKAAVARDAGARPWDRDPIDARIIRQALAGEGKIIDSETEAEGYPSAPETRAPFHEEEWDLATMERRAK
jgi:hypothetical protein